MCLWNTDAPGGNKVKIWQKSYILTPPDPQGQMMSEKIRKIIAMHSVCCCSLPVWRRSFLKKGTPVTFFCLALDPPLDGSGRKTTTLVSDHEYFTPTKFHKNPSSCSGEEVENVKVYGRTDDDGPCAMTTAHLSLWLRWAKKCTSILIFILKWQITPLNVEKIHVDFSVTRPLAFKYMYLPPFSYASLQSKALGV